MTRSAIAYLILCLLFAGRPAAVRAEDKAPSNPETKTLNSISVKNRIFSEKLKKKLSSLEAEKAELEARYQVQVEKNKLALAELEAKLKELQTRNKIAAEEFAAKMSASATQLKEITTSNKLAAELQKQKSLVSDAAYQELAAANRMRAEQHKAELTELTDKLDKLSTEDKLAGQEHKIALAALRREIDKLKTDNDMKAEQLRRSQMEQDDERRGLDLQAKRLDLKAKQLRHEKEVFDARMSKLQSDLEIRSKKEDWKKEANQDPVYAGDPFKDGKLVMSDRRIALNGPIYSGVADFVTDRIHYYNNVSSTQPIFIVIDRSPGGSVMEGYRIVKAIQTSKAPVHVVVKSFAASMAAVITTLADHSYAYPNAIILHHQMSTVNWGNMTQLAEQLEMAKKWEKRLADPVAKKMGVSLEKFRKMMYEKNSDGDWEEFADDAKKYKWVDHIVDEIRETGMVKDPDAFPASKSLSPFSKSAEETSPAGRSAGLPKLAEQTDESGNRFVRLPRLAPFDFYFIYNPDHYYR